MIDDNNHHDSTLYFSVSVLATESLNPLLMMLNDSGHGENVNSWLTCFIRVSPQGWFSRALEVQRLTRTHPANWCIAHNPNTRIHRIQEKHEEQKRFNTLTNYLFLCYNPKYVVVSNMCTKVTKIVDFAAPTSTSSGQCTVKTST